MKFCDKLSKKRKERNLSQEQLADKLNMSRQAISKWESNASYPDMETIIKLCKILDCSINELLDDDAFGENQTFKSNKININDWIKDLLKLITKTYNMFCSMTFSQKIKCIFEILIMILLFALCWTLLGSLFRNSIITLFDILPNKVYSVIISILKFIYEGIGIALGFIVVTHLFKIRYLDYYITIEDNDVKEKKEEKPIDEIKSNKKVEKKCINSKEKVIIRDPKHSSYSFFTAIGKIIMFFIKCFAIFIASFFVISFIGLSSGLVCSIFLLKYSVFFLGIFLFCLGSLGINFIVLYLVFNLIFNKSFSFKLVFIVFITSLLLIGSGIATSINGYLNFNTDYESTENLTTTVKHVDMKNNLVIPINNIVIDDSIADIKLEFKHMKYKEPKIYISDYNNYKVLSYYYDDNIAKLSKELLNYFKDQKEFKYSNTDEVIIYMSKSNYKIIVQNNDNYYND